MPNLVAQGRTQRLRGEWAVFGIGYELTTAATPPWRTRARHRPGRYFRVSGQVGGWLGREKVIRVDRAVPKLKPDLTAYTSGAL